MTPEEFESQQTVLAAEAETLRIQLRQLLAEQLRERFTPSHDSTREHAVEKEVRRIVLRLSDIDRLGNELQAAKAL